LLGRGDLGMEKHLSYQSKLKICKKKFEGGSLLEGGRLMWTRANPSKLENKELEGRNLF